MSENLPQRSAYGGQELVMLLFDSFTFIFFENVVWSYHHWDYDWTPWRQNAPIRKNNALQRDFDWPGRTVQTFISWENIYYLYKNIFLEEKKKKQNEDPTLNLTLGGALGDKFIVIQLLLTKTYNNSDLSWKCCHEKHAQVKETGVKCLIDDQHALTCRQKIVSQ